MSISFSALFSEAQKRPPGPNQYGELIEQSFLAFPDGSGRIRRIGELTRPPKIGRLVLVGVAVYSLPDLELLDTILEHRGRRKHHQEELQVLDILTCQPSDFEKWIPGIGKVLATPIVGIWNHGILIERASGHNAINALRKHYRLSRQFRLGPRFGWPYLQ
jgi:hypothetical protein